jgi:hypothetical protein
MSKLQRFGYENLKGILFNGKPAQPTPEPDKVSITLEEALKGVSIEWEN